GRREGVTLGAAERARPGGRKREGDAMKPTATGARETPEHIVTHDDARVHVSLTVNGRVHAIAVEPRTTLLDALREELALTGTKKACDRGECGACTVHVEGRRVLSCMTLAAMQAGKRIANIEGLERGKEGLSHGSLHAFESRRSRDSCRGPRPGSPTRVHRRRYRPQRPDKGPRGASQSSAGQ